MSEINMKSKSGWIVSVILIIVVIILLILFFKNRKELQTLHEEKELQRTELQKELSGLMARHDSIKKENTLAADMLNEKDSVIQANAKEIEELLGYKWEFYKVQKKLDRLRVITQGYVRQIDSLYTVNIELKQENERIREDIHIEKQKNVELSQEKRSLQKQVTEAAVLKAYNISAYGVRQKGSSGEVETDKAHRVEKIKICFTLGENPLIEPGKKNVYIRIARPDRQIVTIDTSSLYSFSHNGQILQFSIKKEVDYQGKAIEQCTYWAKKDDKQAAMSGRYMVSIYTDENLIGETSFVLN